MNIHENCTINYTNTSNQHCCICKVLRQSTFLIVILVLCNTLLLFNEYFVSLLK